MGHRVLTVIAVIAASAVSSAGPAPTGRVVGKVTVSGADGKKVTAEAVVYVVGFPEPGSGTATATVEQKGRKFVPDLVAITVGESVTFPNGDPFLHNVFSQSPARKFDLGSFKKGESKDKAFPDPGVIDVYCNIHPEMAATILVLPNKRHASIGADGSYVIEGVPPGKWTVFAYTRRATKPESTPVTVVAGQDSKVDFALVRGAEPDHLNKYGEKYRPPTTTYR
jgi:plastocyanin